MESMFPTVYFDILTNIDVIKNKKTASAETVKKQRQFKCKMSIQINAVFSTIAFVYICINTGFKTFPTLHFSC